MAYLSQKLRSVSLLACIHIYTSSRHIRTGCVRVDVDVINDNWVASLQLQHRSVLLTYIYMHQRTDVGSVYMLFFEIVSMGFYMLGEAD